MRMEFRRLTGALARGGIRDWSDITATKDEWREYARDALKGFYDLVGEYSFRPMRGFAPNAPEEVRIVADNGAVLTSYSIKDFIAETKKSLVWL